MGYFKRNVQSVWDALKMEEDNLLGMQICMQFSVLFISLVSFSEARSRQGTCQCCLYWIQGALPSHSKKCAHFNILKEYELSIFESPIICSVCPQILHKPLFSNAPWSTEFFPRAFEDNNLCKVGGGGNRAYYTLPTIRKNNKLLVEFDMYLCQAQKPTGKAVTSLHAFHSKYNSEILVHPLVDPCK